MQSQMKDAFEETALAKQNEESARASAARVAAQQMSLKTEIEHLRDQLQFLREDREAEEAKSGAKQSQDAAVRRLDNERQYLKSQLASEITLKNELHEALFQCQTQLAEANMQWKADIEALRETTTHTVRESTFAQQRLHQTCVSLEAEVARLNQSNKELKEGFTKARDQVLCPALPGRTACIGIQARQPMPQSLPFTYNPRCARSSSHWRTPPRPTGGSSNKWTAREPRRRASPPRRYAYPIPHRVQM